MLDFNFSVLTGFSTNYFALSWGVRQGCPTSPFLFVLVELLACKIRQDKDIQGINIFPKELKYVNLQMTLPFVTVIANCSLDLGDIVKRKHSSGLKSLFEYSNLMYLRMYNKIETTLQKLQIIISLMSGIVEI